jgi:hypothetical protein
VRALRDYSTVPSIARRITPNLIGSNRPNGLRQKSGGARHIGLKGKITFAISEP